jgi:hypothetical protein
MQNIERRVWREARPMTRREGLPRRSPGSSAGCRQPRSWGLRRVRCGEYAEEMGWSAGIVTGLGKNRGDRMVVHLSFDYGHGKRYAAELYWRKPELKGKDKPGRVLAAAAQA